MDIIFAIFLTIHITGGTIGLLTGTVNLIRIKADKRHKLVGKIFVYAMLVTACSSLILSMMHLSYFLFIVGVFTLYMVSSGNRYLYLRLLGSGQKPKTLDWAITIAMLIAGLVFVGMGIWFMIIKNFFGLVFMTFGFLGLLFVKQDFQNYKGITKGKNYWLIAHIGRMSGAYIASLTAFLVVNWKYTNIQLPSFLVWILPSVIVVPFIIKWSRKYEVKKKAIIKTEIS